MRWTETPQGLSIRGLRSEAVIDRSRVFAGSVSLLCLLEYHRKFLEACGRLVGIFRCIQRLERWNGSFLGLFNGRGLFLF